MIIKLKMNKGEENINDVNVEIINVNSKMILMDYGETKKDIKEINIDNKALTKKEDLKETNTDIKAG